MSWGTTAWCGVEGVPERVQGSAMGFDKSNNTGRQGDSDKYQHHSFALSGSVKLIGFVLFVLFSLPSLARVATTV